MKPVSGFLLNDHVTEPPIVPVFRIALVSVVPGVDVFICSQLSTEPQLPLPPPVPLTVKLTPLLATPFTVTTTLPVVAPLGTVTPMLVALQLVTVAAAPLKVTVLDPCVEPKFEPEIVTALPAGPEVGLTLAIVGP